ncbi:organic hydroperoxide resistance protein [Planotetraspora kaengkrachanensis]|uniref:Organic hydroperoxide resistance protein n=1 Tax=Planotetraspora kaengkrachanensis TaxID=575193 RepID=A0A8J3M4Y7_9ACTN|nr:organic hydroperoxide resistance protein [Planotetraspora kaengkrachanensis]GIG79345.1 organic hydroperoxide resistance protein [Planotetraspora kaengkrachanensis]
MSAIYTAVGTATGREGRARTNDGKLDLRLSRPVEMGGDGEGTNPEQLFAMGYSACFASALSLVAKRMKVDASDASVTAEVSLLPVEGGRFGLGVVLRVELPDELQGEVGTELVETAHQVCPYSNATRGNIPVDLVIE